MKKRWLMIGMAAFALLLSACKKEEWTTFLEVLPAERELFRYEGTEGADAIAVDEEGLLYTVSYIPQEDGESVLDTEHAYQPHIQHFCVYDLGGSLVLEKDVNFTDGNVSAMIEEQGKLYCVAGKSVRFTNEPYLYAVDTKTWEVEELCELEGYHGITQIVHIGEYFYFFGVPKNPQMKSYILRPEVYSYTYQGEIVFRINPAAEQLKIERFQVDFPISIFKTSKDTLMVYQYTEEYGFGFLEFSPEDQMLSTAGQKPSSMAAAHFTMCEEGYLFCEQGSLYYGTVGEDSELTDETVSISNDLVYKKGFAFYGNREADKVVERICVASILQENKTIRLLLHADTQDMPFGCGYRMERMELRTEQYALKVLAQDSDFDLFVLSTRNRSSYNLKENGAFYALNEVEWVREYLDACFPYVKELATNEDGDIWMLPIKLAIPVLFYNREYCRKMDVDLTAMDLMDFLCFTEEVAGIDTERRKVSISSYVLREELFGQYAQSNDTFDTPLLAGYLSKMKEIYDRDGEWRFDFNSSSEAEKGNLVDFYYFYDVDQSDYSAFIKAADSLDGLGVMGIPKLWEGSGNVGTLTFLAVNPQAENLEAALDYLSALANYMLGQKDTFLFADEAAYTDTPLVHELYRIYADGEVRFAMDPSIFDKQYLAYLSGEMTLEEMIAESERRRKIYVGE